MKVAKSLDDPWRADVDMFANVLVCAVRDAIRLSRRRAGTPDLVVYLDTMGVRHFFDRVYGSDLVNVWKHGPAYYRAILADTRTDPATAVVVDDSEDPIRWAGECGLRGVQVRRQPGEAFEDSVLRAFDRVDEMLA